MMNKAEFRNLNFTLLGKKSDLKGNLIFSGDTLINGKVEGTLTVADEGKLTLEREASVDGDIFCHDIEVFGRVTGSIDASGTLSVRASAEISGTINAKHISIFPGAQINMDAHTSEEHTPSKNN